MSPVDDPVGCGHGLGLVCHHVEALVDLSQNRPPLSARNARLVPLQNVLDGVLGGLKNKNPSMCPFHRFCKAVEKVQDLN